MPGTGTKTQVLIVGAGPTGLVLALWLNRLGIKPRIVDRAPGTGEASRALAVQARTIEFYQALGLSETVVAAGVPFGTVNLWVRGKRRARVRFGRAGEGLSPFPSALVLPQDIHERILAERLDAEGVRIEWGSELVTFTEEDGGVRARVRTREGAVSEVRTDYLCGCDGARSTVRGQLGTGFPGGTYDRIFYVADVEAEGAVVDGELHVGLEAADFCLVFPMKGDNAVRLVGLVDTPGRGQPDLAHLAYDEVRGAAERALGLSVSRVNWFSTYHVHHRVAEAFRRGRVFLLGDAAHIHSPAGGQGMNTGIGDAINLAWKLAMALDGRAGPDILDTYETERIGFARRLVSTTDQAFRAAVGQSPLARFIRMEAVPVLLSWLGRLRPVQRLAFRTLSQISVAYRDSRLSEGRLGALGGGDRLPWVEGGDGRSNFEPLCALAWHVQVHGTPEPALTAWCDRNGLPLHVFPFTAKTAKAGFRHSAAYLVRPDGHIACVAADQKPQTFDGYQSRRGLVLAGQCRPTQPA